MDPITVIYKIQKRIKDTLQQIGDIMMGGEIDNMEKYKYLLGQANALQLVLQDISNLLQDKEQTDGKDNVIKIDPRSTEN